MTLGEMRTEVEARGFDYTTTNRINDWLNRSYRAICSRKPWPFLEAEMEATPPFEVPELWHVLSVSDVQNETFVRGVTRQFILERSPTLNSSGVPRFWYLEGEDTLVAFPPNEDTLRVRYIKRPALLEESSEPLIPEEWQYLIIDSAIVYALKDNDEYAAARELKGDVEVGLAEMVHDLMKRDYQRNPSITRTGLPGDYVGGGWWW